MRLTEWRIKSLRQNILTFGRVGRKSINFCSHDGSRKGKKRGVGRSDTAAVWKRKWICERFSPGGGRQKPSSVWVRRNEKKPPIGISQSRNQPQKPQCLHTLATTDFFFEISGSSVCVVMFVFSRKFSWSWLFSHEIEAYQKSEKSHTCTAAASACFVLSVEHSIVFYLGEVLRKF